MDTSLAGRALSDGGMGFAGIISITGRLRNDFRIFAPSHCITETHPLPNGSYFRIGAAMNGETDTTATRVAVIGGGLGGMSTAIALAARGYHVGLYEKNARLGGKLNVLQRDGYTFDLGPSILTFPEIFRQLFSLGGKSLEDYVIIESPSVHWRNFFEDGTQIDLIQNLNEQKEFFAAIDPKAPKEFDDFLSYSARQYTLVQDAYFDNGADNLRNVLTSIAPWRIMQLDALRSMSAGVNAHFSNRYLRNIFSFFSKYIGSSADQAPAFLNLLPWVQYGFGLWYVRGGMYGLTNAMSKLMDELGVTVHLNAEVKKASHSGSCVDGIRLSDGRFVSTDIVVSNMEVIPACRELLHASERDLKRLRKFEPSCSGLLIHLGLDRQYTGLAHHNFLFSKNPGEHYDSVYNKYRLPDDPTIYLVAPGRTDQLIAPEGCDVLKLLPHIPHLTEPNKYSRDDYLQYGRKILKKCMRMVAPDLKEHIVHEHIWTPYDIQQEYYSNMGSIYGVVSDRKKNMAFKASKRSMQFRNMYFVGGSVNPGCGMPMVVMGGMQAAALIERNHPVRKTEFAV